MVLLPEFLKFETKSAKIDDVKMFVSALSPQHFVLGNCEEQVFCKMENFKGMARFIKVTKNQCSLDDNICEQITMGSLL